MLADNEQTRVIVLYMESVSDGNRFVKTAREVTQRKPVIALKVGRFESGQKAASSHTGALAASDTAFEAAFAKAGIFRAETAEQMFDWAVALEHCPLPRGKRVAVLTNAGGPGVIAADALEMNGLRLAQLSEATLKTLNTILPPAAGIYNPVDMLASASPQNYADCLKLLLDDSGRFRHGHPASPTDVYHRVHRRCDHPNHSIIGEADPDGTARIGINRGGAGKIESSRRW